MSGPVTSVVTVEDVQMFLKEPVYKMQHLEVSGAVRPIYGSLGVKRLKTIYVHLLVCSFNKEGEVNEILKP